MIVRRFPAFRRNARPVFLTSVLAAILTIPAPAFADTDLALGGTAVIAYADGDNVRLRDGASYDAGLIAWVPEGTTVYPIDGPFTADDGSLWFQVEANGATGYIVSDYLANSAGILTDTSGTAVTRDSVNVRTAPGIDAGVVTTLPSGTTVALTGDNANGWLSVDVDGVAGYVYGAFVTSGGESVPVDAVSTAETAGGVTGVRYTDDALNFRSGPTLEAGVISVLGLGTEVELTGVESGGFVEVLAQGQAGWVAAEFLMASPPGDGPTVDSTPASLIAWPVGGGTWSVLQGYNGSSHQNRTDLWQYKYSIDLVYEDGATAGQPVYSPVSGTVRWYDESTGGVSIDMGNGYAFAMFHVLFDAGIPEGARVEQGQYMGQIAPAGVAAAGGTPHIHLAVWETSDGGNWSRSAVPFVGALAIGGAEFPDNGASYDHTGEVFSL